jgi:hypothetical protein
MHLAGMYVLADVSLSVEDSISCLSRLSHDNRRRAGGLLRK